MNHRFLSGFYPLAAAGWAIGLLQCSAAPESASSQIEVAETTFNFQVVDLGQPVEHTFTFKNKSSTVLHPNRVAVTKPLAFEAVSPQIDPGEEAMVRFRLGSPRKLGPFAGTVELSFKESEVADVVLEVVGYVQPCIEVAPIPAFFVAVPRGQTNHAALQLINHESAPLQILGIEHTSSRFTTQLLTNEPGQRYTLALTLPGQGRAGTATETILVRTSSRKQPLLQIAANTMVKERIYTFPQEVDFESVNLGELRKKPSLTNLLTQTLMVYQHGGTNFELSAKISLPFLRVEAEPAKTHDRWQLTIRPDLEQMTPGHFDGGLILQTNDPEFPWLNVPVRIVVTEDGARSAGTEPSSPQG